MNPTVRRLLLLGALVAPLSGSVPAALAAPAQTVAEQTAQTRARALLEQFYAVNLTAMWAAFTPEVKAQWGNLEGFTQYRKTGVEQFGAQKELVAEKTFMRGGVSYYVRSATFEKAPQIVWALTFGFDQLGRISEFGITLEHDRSQDQVAMLAR
ncbi:hypothetical protein DKM44_08380 [Deinococcus irradiatisoli]|uniref:DUF4019 domain-containing protein n=1 Tax=Deinococcus irradiatisoli TaxID=2202254 RepID=A0A2Z3JNX7_9DEIO|nr:hypothetical protein [Deinococcus irradiatisoli]AWN23238.1 hypothetical protein DKM44_08380 [Deinococcus irradiatisoli]